MQLKEHLNVIENVTAPSAFVHSPSLSRVLRIVRGLARSCWTRRLSRPGQRPMRGVVQLNSYPSVPVIC